MKGGQSSARRRLPTIVFKSSKPFARFSIFYHKPKLAKPAKSSFNRIVYKETRPNHLATRPNLHLA